MKTFELPAGLRALGEGVQDAFEAAESAHAHQVRKGDGAPYITHPVAVAEIVHEAGLGEDAVAAALLHDVVEDTPITLEALESRFGQNVVELVRAMTEDKGTYGYETRKNEHRDEVEAAGPLAAALYAADKLANLRDMRRLYAEVGERAEARFHTSLDTRVELWWRDLEMIERVAEPSPHIERLRAELEGFEADRSRLP